MTPLMLRTCGPARTALRCGRTRPCGAGRRFIQTQTTAAAGPAEAYLEPVPDHPGVVSLLLNRPKAKNAISLRLLKVGFLPSILGGWARRGGR